MRHDGVRDHGDRDARDDRDDHDVHDDRDGHVCARDDDRDVSLSFLWVSLYELSYDDGGNDAHVVSVVCGDDGDDDDVLSLACGDDDESLLLSYGDHDEWTPVCAIARGHWKIGYKWWPGKQT